MGSDLYTCHLYFILYEDMTILYDDEIMIYDDVTMLYGDDI